MKIEDLFEDNQDQSALDDKVYKSLEGEVETFAKDESREWPNALAVVHDAYEVCHVERPTPAMRDAWIQYEALITLAVQYLNKHRPNGNWRVTASTSKVKL